MGDKFNNFFNKIISDSPNNTCNISMDAYIMFN